MPLFFQFILLGCFWGGSFIAIKFSLESVPFAIAVLIRIAIGLVFLITVGIVTRRPLKVEKRWIPWVWLNGVLSIGAPFLFLFWAEQRASAGIAGIMNGTVPIWTALMGFVFLREYERASWRKVAGVVLGLVGVVLLFLPSITAGLSIHSWSGLLALLMMALLYASGTLLAKQLFSGQAKVPVFAAAVHQHVASLAVVGLYCALTPHVFPETSWKLSSLVALIYLGVFSTGLAFMLFFGLVSQWGAVRASTVTYLVPTVCLLLDFAVFGNIPHWNEFFGMAIIFSGIFLVQRSALNATPPRQ